MKKLFIIIFLLFGFSSVNSQTGFRIKLIKNLNPYPFFGGVSYSALWGYTAPKGREYAILGCFNGTSFIDITDTANVIEVDFLPLPAGVNGSLWREMKTYSHYAYIVSESPESKIQIVDLQYLPDSIRYVGLSNIPDHSTTHSISQSGQYLYLNGGNPGLSSGIAVIDLSNPETPTIRGKWHDMYVHDSRIINDTIWACNISDGKVSIINALNKDSLTTIRNWTNSPSPNAPHNIALTENRRYAFVTDEVFDNIMPGRMKVWDISNLDNITYITSFIPVQFENTVVHNVEVYQNLAFLAYYAAGVKVLDISNPVNPIEIGWFDTYPINNLQSNGCWGVYYFPTGKIIASDMTSGLFVLRPNLTIPVAGMPKADLTVAAPQVLRYAPQSFIDMTEGFPSSWEWTITGPENQTSNLRNPSLVFDALGEYNVKLRASNSFGTDSIIKTNVFRVLPAPLVNFVTTNPPGSIYRILTSPGDTSKVLFNWRKSVNHPEIFYKIYFKKILGSSEQYILSGNNGRDTSYLITKSYLDSMALRFGLNGDSVLVFYRVKAYNETDSLASLNSVTLILKRNKVGISSINELLPTEYKLFNNYPNPFNPSTNILFDIPKKSFVKLILYNLSGKEILKIADDYLDAGSYKYSFDMSGLSSGAYFVRLVAGDYNSAIKIVLIK